MIGVNDLAQMTSFQQGIWKHKLINSILTGSDSHMSEESTEVNLWL